MTSYGIRRLEARDVGPIAAAFLAAGWKNKPRSQYERYLAEQEDGRRTVLVASLDGASAGYVTIAWRSGYAPFKEGGIPEIQDFNVLPHLRRRGIGTRLMDAAERAVARRSDVVGIGVGVSPDYGAAQRLYVLRGYVPDGRGLVSDGRSATHGESVPVDDGLVFYFTKALTETSRSGGGRA